MEDLDNKENIETSFNNIKINIDKLEGDGENLSNSYDKLSLDDLTEEPVLDTQPPQLEELAKIEPKPKKVDRRKTTSRLNIAKARQAKARKKAEQQARLKQLFGDSDSEDTETGSDTESEEETYINKYHKHKYQQLYSQTRKELNEMRGLLFKMAEKNKKSRRKTRSRRKKERTPSPEPEPEPQQQPAPIVNVYTTQPQPIKQPDNNSLFTKMLKNRLKS